MVCCLACRGEERLNWRAGKRLLPDNRN